jgi:hypothetical protein
MVNPIRREERSLLFDILGDRFQARPNSATMDSEAGLVQDNGREPFGLNPRDSSAI